MIGDPVFERPAHQLADVVAIPPGMIGDTILTPGQRRHTLRSLQG